MRGKTCVITGGTSGIGRAAALALGALGADVVLLGRNEAAGEAVVRKLGRNPRAGAAQFVRADLADQSQVRRAAALITARCAAIDVLINNAGARHDRFQASPQGIELTFAGNHLGHFLLTALLLDRLLAASAARIITVSSGSHGSVPADGVWELTSGNYDRRQAYARSKLANLVFALALANRLGGTPMVSNAYDPGGVASNFSRNNGLISWGRHLVSHALRRELASPGIAAGGIVGLASAPELQGVSGRYFRRRTEISPAAACQDAMLARSLWDLSIRLTGLDEGIGAKAWQIFRL